MKVVQILYSGLGGHGSVAFSIISGDSEKECVFTMMFYGTEKLLNDYQEKCYKSNILFDYVKKSRKIDILSWWRVFRYLTNIRPKIIILHSTNLIIPVKLFASLYRAKIVAVEHTSIETKRRIEHLYSTFTFLMSHKVVFLTKNILKKASSRYFFFKSKKSSVIANGIDVSFFKRSKKNEFLNINKIAMISRFSQQKDHPSLLKAIFELPNLNLLLAGQGESFFCVEKLKELMSLGDRVHLLGLLNQNQIQELLDDSDIYVHSVLKGESMPTSILQAMAMGVPIIGSDVPGINDLITDGHNGILFREADYHDLRDKVLYLIFNPQLCKELVQNARKLIEENYSDKLMFENYKKIMLE